MAGRCFALRDAGVPNLEYLARAEAFATLAAAHGYVDDRLGLSALLRVQAFAVANTGDIARACGIMARAEALCADLTGVRLSSNLNFLGAMLMHQVELGSPEAESVLDRIVAALTPAEAAAFRNEVAEAVTALRDMEPTPTKENQCSDQ
jgi:hypothetical protein